MGGKKQAGMATLLKIKVNNKTLKHQHFAAHAVLRLSATVNCEFLSIFR